VQLALCTRRLQIPGMQSPRFIRRVGPALVPTRSGLCADRMLDGTECRSAAVESLSLFFGKSMTGYGADVTADQPSLSKNLDPTVRAIVMRVFDTVMPGDRVSHGMLQAIANEDMRLEIDRRLASRGLQLMDDGKEYVVAPYTESADDPMTQHTKLA
jgi:hypothetical protein